MSSEDREDNRGGEKGNLWTGEEHGAAGKFEALEEADFSEENVRRAEVDEEALQEQLKPFETQPSRETLDKPLD